MTLYSTTEIDTVVHTALVRFCDVRRRRRAHAPVSLSLRVLVVGVGAAADAGVEELTGAEQQLTLSEVVVRTRNALQYVSVSVHSVSYCRSERFSHLPVCIWKIWHTTGSLISSLYERIRIRAAVTRG